MVVVLVDGDSNGRGGHSWFLVAKYVMSEGMCFKGCISGCAMKSSSVWEATLPFTPGLPTGVVLNGVFYYISSCMRVRFMGKEDPN